MKKIVFGFFLIFKFIVVHITFEALNVCDGGQNKSLANFVIPYSILSGVVLWAWMFSSFFNNRNLRGKILWGWALLFFNMLAGVFYFLVVYFSSERKDKVQNSTPDNHY